MFEGTAAIVTGSSRGIGLAVARALGAQGAAVVVNGRVGEAVDVAVASLQESGAAAVGVVGDCADQGVVDRMLEAAQSIGELEALVACAGTPSRLAPRSWRSIRLNGSP
ncbi:MAG: SDR family NAD(P)-dependent oxidoreductase [Marmoricola sp.]